MKILYISPPGFEPPAEKLRMLEERAVGTTSLSPTLLSAFTAMKLAKAIDQESVDIIMASRLKDAMAAISGRQLAKKKGVKVVVEIAPNSPAPLGIPKDITEGVDLWIFPSERLQKAFPINSGKSIVMPPAQFLLSDEEVENCRKKITEANRSKKVISWIGDITRPERLKQAIDAVEKTNGLFTLRIAGAGVAAKVMPVVKYSRAIVGKENIVWVGEEYNLASELAQTDAVIRTDDDTTAIETAALNCSLPIIAPEEIADFISGNFEKPPHSMDAVDAYINSLLKALGNL